MQQSHLEWKMRILSLHITHLLRISLWNLNPLMSGGKKWFAPVRLSRN